MKTQFTTTYSMNMWRNEEIILINIINNYLPFI